MHHPARRGVMVRCVGVVLRCGMTARRVATSKGRVVVVWCDVARDVVVVALCSGVVWSCLT